MRDLPDETRCGQDQSAVDAIGTNQQGVAALDSDGPAADATGQICRRKWQTGQVMPP